MRSSNIVNYHFDVNLIVSKFFDKRSGRSTFGRLQGKKAERRTKQF